MTSPTASSRRLSTSLTKTLLVLLSFATFYTKSRGVTSSLTFNLPYGQRKCFMEDLPSVGTVKGTVHVASGKGDMSLDMFVSDSRGAVHAHKSDVNSVKFSFKLPVDDGPQHHSNGDGRDETYRFCVINQVHPQAVQPKDAVGRKVTLEISYSSNQHIEQLSKLAKTDHAERLFSTFSSVSSDVDQLIRALDELRSKEQELTKLNETTASTILFISLLACLFTILTGILSFMSLKSFFKRKKLA